jgi:2-polyprenyl-3-methyl-5-hydroxy-6-metoxy-1,4-benzoquinol methylase
VDSKESYERLWTDTWGDLQRFGPVHRHQNRAIVELVRTLGPRTVCDVGCGSGENLATIGTSEGIALVGTDISEQALALARRRVPGATFTQLDIQSAWLPEQFDLVTSIQVVEHLHDDIAAMRNMGRMARAWVLVTTMSGSMRPSELEIGHLRNYSHADLRAKADAAGLEVVDIFGWGFPFYTPLYRTVVEWLPGGVPHGRMGRASRLMADILYQVYRLNIPRRGDVTTLLARPRGAAHSGGSR